MTRRKNSTSASTTKSNGRANGHANGCAGANGQTAALASVAAASAGNSDGFAAHLHRAGSDDCTAVHAAGSASSAGARATRDAYAELAQAESAVAEGKWLRPPGAACRTVNDAATANSTGGANEIEKMSSNTGSRSNGSGGSGSSSGSRAARTEKSESTFSLTPPGTEQLPLDGATFVEAVHERVDLIALEEQLLRSADEKIVQRELAYPMLTVAQLAPLKDRDPYLYETLTKIVSAVNSASQAAGVDSSTPSPAPTSVASISVQQQQLSGVLTPQFQSILNNPGLSPADKAAVTSNSQGSIASAFDSLQQSAANRVARTRNSAGFADLTDDLARQKASAEGNQAAQNQLSFSNTAFQRQMAALQGLSGLYGVDSNLLGRTLGIPAQLLNVRANASRPSGFFSSLGNSAGAGLGSTVGGLAGALL